MLKSKLKIISNHKGLFAWTVFSCILMVVGFLHIPILVWCGVDVFALRGLLVITALPIVAIFAIPIAICILKWDKIRKENKKISDK